MILLDILSILCKNVDTAFPILKSARFLAEGGSWTCPKPRPAEFKKGEVIKHEKIPSRLIRHTGGRDAPQHQRSGVYRRVRRQGCQRPGTYLIARSEDQGQGDYNKMFQVQPRVENVPGRFITDTATGFQIPLPATTYKYTYVPDYTRGDDGMYPGSCTNEYGVSITATVSTSTCEAWEAEDPFVEPGLREAILAASVAAVSTTAREAVDVLLGYVDEYGSEEGNTVMITDQDEAWIVEIYGRHQYCAMKMPDDKVAVFGNHNMIGLVDPKATPEDGYIYSDGLFDTIDKLGLAVKEGELYHLAKSVTNNTREDYNNMRNWAGMTILAPSLAGEYDSDEFYPLFYSPDEKVSVLTVMDIYRNRYEGTPGRDPARQ